MTVILKTDLTGLGDFPNLAEQIPGIPSDGLQAFWRDSLFTFNGGNVAAWGSFGGEDAVQTDANAQPAYSAGTVTGDATDDYLETSLAAPSEGYIVLRVVPGTIAGATRSLIGAQVSGSERLWIGMNTAGLFGCAIGSQSVTQLQASGAPTTGNAETIGVHYEGGNATLRRNGAVVDTGAYAPGTVPTVPMFLLARNQANAPVGLHGWGLRGAAVYGKAGGYSTGELDAIDAVMSAL